MKTKEIMEVLQISEPTSGKLKKEGIFKIKKQSDEQQLHLPIHFSPAEKIILRKLVENAKNLLFVEEISVFGSRLRRCSHEESDLDVLVIVRERPSPQETLLLRENLNPEEQAYVSLTVLTYKEMDKKTSFAKELRKRHVVWTKEK